MKKQVLVIKNNVMDFKMIVDRLLDEGYLFVPTLFVVTSSTHHSSFQYHAVLEKEESE